MAGPGRNTPGWMKSLVRARMEETGEKYTAALRAVRAEHEARKEKDETE